MTRFSPVPVTKLHPNGEIMIGSEALVLVGIHFSRPQKLREEGVAMKNI